MRKILYRGKEIKTGKWVYGGFHEHKPSITAIGKQPETVALIIADGDADWDLPVSIKACVVEKKTVGEFTGLTDKNGAKIFEGDIVNHQGGKYIVKYTKILCAFEMYMADDGSTLRAACLIDSVVTGSVHDHPELLERE
jgi:uncharacterized phage protein (TIGR01671 family)